MNMKLAFLLALPLIGKRYWTIAGSYQTAFTIGSVVIEPFRLVRSEKKVWRLV